MIDVGEDRRAPILKRPCMKEDNNGAEKEPNWLLNPLTWKSTWKKICKEPPLDESSSPLSESSRKEKLKIEKRDKERRTCTGKKPHGDQAKSHEMRVKSSGGGGREQDPKGEEERCVGHQH